MTLRAIGAAASTIISRSRIPCCCCQIHRHHHRHQQLLRFLWSSSCSRRGRGRKVIDMASLDGELRAFMVAGEVSGDLLGARLMAALKKVSPFSVRFAGVGGALMNKEGLQTLFPMEDIAVMGIWELLPHLYKIRIHLKETVEAAVLFRPHVVVTIDSKGFSFRFLKKLKEICTEDNANPVHVHYVAPSFWAWKGGETRLGRLNEFIDHILCILPFEEEMCRSVGLSSTYVGHPLLEDALHLNPECKTFSNKWKFKGNGDAFLHKHGLSTGATVITLLPGSRLQEVTRMLPIFLQTMEQLKDSFTKLSIVIPIAPNHLVKTYIEKEIGSWSLSAILISGTSMEEKYDAFSASRAAIATSGSAVMELQLAALPCVVAYRAHFLTEWVIQQRAKLKFISLPNIILDSAIIPEKLFKECTSDNLAAALSKIILDDKARHQQIAAAEKLFAVLQLPQVLDSDSCCPSMIAASAILHEAKTVTQF